MMFFRRKEEKFVSPMEGTLIRLEDVPDAVFSEKMMGDGFAVELTGGCITAPVSGVLESAFPTGHAFGIRTREGMEVLLHIGLDTVQLKGRGFEVQVRQGEKITQGALLAKVDLNYIKSAGKSVISPVIFTSGEQIEILKEGAVKNGDAEIAKIQNLEK